MRDRILWIDSLRAIGIFFVVLIHTGRIHNPLILNYIKSFFIPLFFFISGIVANKQSYQTSLKEFIKNISQRLLIPYLFFSLTSYFIWLFILRYFKDIPFKPLRYLIGIIYSSGSGNWLSFNISLWFFTCLFIVQIITFFLFKISDRRKLYLALFSLSIIGYLSTNFLTSPNYRLPWSFEIAPTATVFFGIGYCLRFYILNNLLKEKNRLYVIFISLFCSLVFSYLNTTVEFYVGIYGNYFYFYIAALSGILFWINIAYLLKPNRLFTAVGQNTLTIFSMHLNIIPFLTGFLVYGLGIEKRILDSGIFIAFGYAICSIMILLPISKLMYKQTPLLLGKLKSSPLKVYKQKNQ